MTNEELVLNMLAELSTTSITKSKNPQTLEDNMQCAADGGDVARVPSPVGIGLGHYGGLNTFSYSLIVRNKLEFNIQMTDYK